MDYGADIFKSESYSLRSATDHKLHKYNCFELVGLDLELFQVGRPRGISG